MASERPLSFHKWSHHAYMLLAVTHFTALVWGDFSEVTGGPGFMQVMYVVTGSLGLLFAFSLGAASILFSKEELAEALKVNSAPTEKVLALCAFLAGASWFEAYKVADITLVMVGVSWAFMAALDMAQRHAWRRWALENPSAS